MAGKTVAKNGPKIEDASDVQRFAPLSPGELSYDQITAQGVDSIVGFDLAKDELADALVGLPFVITKMVFRPGVGAAGTMLTCECVLGSADALRRRRVNITELPWEPEALIAFNDGSTGIFRQAMEYLTNRGYILLPDKTKPEGGAAGESRYDVSPDELDTIRYGTYETHEDGTFRVYSVDVRLSCPRGLRISNYDWTGQAAKTRYLG